jgi:hypothetical protein
MKNIEVKALKQEARLYRVCERGRRLNCSLSSLKSLDDECASLAHRLRLENESILYAPSYGSRSI